VPEIYDGIVEVKSVARDPGSRAKIASSPTIPRSIRRRLRRHEGLASPAVVNELQARRSTSSLVARSRTFIVNALQPAEVMKVVLDEDSTRIEVVVPTISSRSRSDAAARTCASPRS